MKLEALDHPKTLDFSSRLGIKLPTAIGHLELLWAFTSTKTPQGNIGKWPDGAIAMACHWEGDPRQFVQALIDARLVDESHQHRLLIHDWTEHAQSWVRMKLAKAKLPFLTAEPIAEPTRKETEPIAERSAEATTESTAEGLTRARVPSHAKPSLATPSHAQEGRADDRDAFLRLRAVYPTFSGDQSDWLLAERACQQRVEEGITWQELEDGARRFAIFVASGGRSSPLYVNLPSKFFGNGLWRQPWDAPPTKGEQLLDANIAAAAEAKRRLFGETK